MPESPFTDAIDGALLYERDELNTGWAILSKRWSIGPDRLKKRYRYLIEFEIEKDRLRFAGETKCLGIGCGKRFMSEHRVNIRFCDSCRIKNEEIAHNMRENVTFGR